ncbi:MAG: glycogen/starch synthase, partial [Chlamydiota bacterium]
HLHLLNILKGAIVYADSCTTVSPSYAKEIQTVEGGCGLNRLLTFYSSKLVGILNGIDISYWNPETDPLIPHKYSPKNKDQFFKNKARCKDHLKKRLHLNEGNKPLIGIVTRLVHQKGLDLIVQALHRTVETGGQFILMGSSPDPIVTERFNLLQEAVLPTHEAHLELKHNEILAHQIFAGCDAFIIPSLFEPCGLTQQISLKYGTLPIARRTGGLADTVFDVETSPHQKMGNGFTFDHPTTEGVNWGVDRTLKTFMHKRILWQELMIKAANLDLSWHLPAGQYLQLYGHH